MKRIADKKYWPIILIFLVGGAISWNLYFRIYLQKDTVDIAAFPREFNEWKSQELYLSESELAILETRNAFIRKYFNRNEVENYLYVVYSQTNRKVSHPPEVCYSGSGVDIIDSRRNLIKIENNKEIEVNQILIERKNTQQVVFYWFKVGDTYTNSYWHQQMLIAVKTFLGKPASSALIRLSATVLEGDKEATVKQLKSFGSIIIPYLNQYLP